MKSQSWCFSVFSLHLSEGELTPSLEKRNPFPSFLRLLWKIGDFVSHFTTRYIILIKFCGYGVKFPFCLWFYLLILRDRSQIVYFTIYDSICCLYNLQKWITGFISCDSRGRLNKVKIFLYFVHIWVYTIILFKLQNPFYVFGLFQLGYEFIELLLRVQLQN